MFERVNRIVDKVEGFAIAGILALATILTFIQVVFRYGLNDSIFWAEEAILYLIISMTFLSTSLGIRRGTHITVDVVKVLVSQTYLPIFKAISATLGLAFAAALLYYGGNLFYATLMRGQLSPALRLPVASIYAFIPITASLQMYRYSELIYSAYKEHMQRK
ncbi:TRAP transporter small permease [Vibrio sp. RC27]